MKRNSLVFVFILLLILLTAGFFSFNVLLPRYIEKKLLPDLGRSLSASLNGRVYRIGITAADLGNIVLGAPLKSGVSIAAIHADYTLSSLMAGKLERLEIAGLILRLEISDGRITVPGLDLEKISGNKDEQETSRKTGGLNLPIEPADFQVSNSFVEITYEGRRYLLPFNLLLRQIRPGNRGSGYTFNLQLMPVNGEIFLTGTIDPAENKAILTLAADSLHLPNFIFPAGERRVSVDPGPVALKGNTEMNLLPFELVSANLTLSPESVQVGNTVVRFGRNGSEQDSGVNFELHGDREQLQVRMQGSISEPLVASLALDTTVAWRGDGVQGSGNAAIGISGPMQAGKNDRPLFILNSTPELRADFIFSLAESGGWKAEITSPAANRQEGEFRNLQLQYDRMSLQTEVPALTIQGQGTGDTREMQISLAFPAMQLRYEGAEVAVADASLDGSYKQQETGNEGSTSSAAFRLGLNGVEFHQEGINGRADIFLQGNLIPLKTDKTETLQAEGSIRISDGEIAAGDAGLKLHGVAASIPWSRTRTAQEMQGKIEAPRLHWQEVDLGSFRADVILREGKYVLDGKYSSGLLKEITADISAVLEKDASGFHGELGLHSAVTPFTAIDLGRLAPALKQSYLSGELGFDGALTFKPDSMRGSLRVDLQAGTFAAPEKNYEISGINFSMLFPELPDLHTAPAQTMSFARASVGNLTFSKGTLVWQLESATSFFLEEGVVQWAGGRVFTNSVRLHPEMKEVVAPIFCDRLKLTELLHQFGISDAAGEGTVNGRIPVRLSSSTIEFEDGFLYSSPGQGGSIKVTALDMLSAGIPKNTPQFSQVDFAAEALKNFQYNWVRLLLDSEGEYLVMQMQMDGKPVQSLPFSYDSRTGILQRTEDGAPGINQPIRLDVNFRLPLNRFLGYSGKIQDLMKNIK